MRRDGTPQMSPVGCAVDDTGRVVIPSRETAVKVKNVRRDPRGWLCVFPDSFYGGFVQGEGGGGLGFFSGGLDERVGFFPSLCRGDPDLGGLRRPVGEEERVV